MAKEHENAESQPLPTAWALPAAKSCRFKVACEGEESAYEVINPGDAMLLLDESGEIAWGVRRVFFVRRERDRSIIYFDRFLDFERTMPLQTIRGGAQTLRKIDLEQIDDVLASYQSGRPKDPSIPEDEELLPLDFSELCEMEVGDDSKGQTRAYVRELLETVVTDDLLGPALGPHEEIVGMSVRDRYILGRLGPRRVESGSVSGSGECNSALPTSHAHLLKSAQAEQVEMTEDGEAQTENKDGNADHIDHGDSKMGASDIAEEEVAEDVVDGDDILRSNSLVPSSMGLTFCIDESLPDVEVEARWGSYYRTDSETAFRDNGKPFKCWKRVPLGGKQVLKLAEGKIASFNPDNSIGQVCVVGSVSKPVEGSRLVTLFLVNKQEERKELRDAAWIFQPELIVRSPDGKAIFRKRPLQNLSKDDEEMKSLDMLYRRKVEFAVGHNISVHAVASEGDYELATEVRTVSIPHFEVPATEVPGAFDGDRPVLKDIASKHLLDMYEIAKCVEDGDLAKIDASAIGLIVDDYAAWIEEQKAIAQTEGFSFFKKSAEINLKKCEGILARLREGVKTLKNDANARKAFAFANTAMAEQRIHSIFSLLRRQKQNPGIEEIRNAVKNHEWRPFQLAFILLAIPSLADPTHKDRTCSADAFADLLWFPTGGGKTEAYLGVAAFAMAVRRLQGNLGGLDSSRGLAVIMRYTLRLLTVQQFQRAATLICAMEKARSEHPETWGKEPFSLGLWVGNKTTPNSYKDSRDIVRKAHEGNPSSGATPAQLTTCPWCGADIREGTDVVCHDEDMTTRLFCSDFECDFSQHKHESGIPVKTVDDEMYHRPPSMMIGTVDKFAQMAWRGSVRTLFGKAEKECVRHGIICPDDDCNGFHVKPATHPKAIQQIRPPDLIIQDEFHLISGPLGTMVGLYESAVDELCSWSSDGTNKIHPKIVASTATVRMADEQINRVFYRKCSVFPPSGIDIEDNFFSKQRPTEDKFGRDYMGVCALGTSRPAALIRTYVAFLTAGQTLFDSFGRLADPYMTVIGYFNSLRELGGMRRLSEDDVQTRSYRVALDSRVRRPGLSQRRVTMIDELTSRVSSRSIPEKLNQLEVEFKAGYAKGEARPMDIVLATNMLSVGVDVDRLGLMIANGQPKNTAEYIQATSRVGRKHPGVVCTVFAWARPRDFSHYEAFEHYHATFYKQVEAQSVTPFSKRALDRGLTGALVSDMRLANPGLSANRGAAELKSAIDPRAKQATDAFSDRAAHVMDNEVGNAVRDELKDRIDRWVKAATQAGRTLGYETESKAGEVVGHLKRPGLAMWDKETVPTSMREVESSVRLIMNKSTIDGDGGPKKWEFRPADDEAGSSEETQATANDTGAKE